MGESAAIRRDEWIELFSFMAASARGLVDEPQMYGPFRLLDSLERLIAILGEQGILRDEFLKNQREKIMERKFLVMSDQKAFGGLLDELVNDFTRELLALN
jgi:hypothetical protein